jgi:hypothetical protein
MKKIVIASTLALALVLSLVGVAAPSPMGSRMGITIPM